jgi:predicted dehydrogenase
VDALLLRDDIDVVSICSYPHDHAAQAMAAAAAGKHLIIEKPLALSWRDCCAVERAVRKSGVKTCVCFECRYSSQFLTTKALLDSGLLGAGCHALDALLLCLGPDVDSVTSLATGSRNKAFAQYEYPSTSVTLLKFKNGRLGKCTSSIDCLQPYYFHTHLIGSEGSLLDNKFYSTKLKGLNKSSWSELALRLLDSGDVADHPYQTQFETFFQSLAKDQEMPLTSLKDAPKTHEIIFAADLSAKSRRPVKLTPKPASRTTS